MMWCGFDDKWCEWVHQCIGNAKTAVLVNGEPTNWFKTKRGVRQGDPISPYLFIMVAEGLSRLTDEAVRNKLWNGLGPTEDGRIALIQYADDTLFFCEARKKQLRNLKFVWQLFEWASGLKVNKDKTELFYTGSRVNRGTNLAHIVGCNAGALPTKYLGLPLSNKRPNKEVWSGVIGKIQRRIEGWQAKLLSRGGRLTLVNAVLTNIPLYLFSIFRAPKWVTSRIEVLRRDFFWKGNAEALGWGRLVAWGKVCRTNKEGGLGILDLSLMNEALLCKWWWKLLTSPELQWNKLIHGLYYARRSTLGEGRSFRPDSQWWRDVLSCRETFKGGVSYSLGDGRLINFWTERWCGDKALSSLCAELFNEVDRKSIKVCDCAAQNKWRWQKILRGACTRGLLGRERVRKLKAWVGDM